MIEDLYTFLVLEFVGEAKNARENILRRTKLDSLIIFSKDSGQRVIGPKPRHQP